MKLNGQRAKKLKLVSGLRIKIKKTIMEKLKKEYLGTYRGEDMYGNEATKNCVDYLSKEIERLMEQKTDLELKQILLKFIR